VLSQVALILSWGIWKNSQHGNPAIILKVKNGKVIKPFQEELWEFFRIVGSDVNAHILVFCEIFM